MVCRHQLCDACQMTEQVPISPFQEPVRVVDRRIFLPEVASGLRVLHLGCADDGLTAVRFGTGDLLHEELSKVAQTLTGVDLSRDALGKLASFVPGTYICGDVEHLADLNLPSSDLVIATELIEHLGNPLHFLKALRQYLERTGATAILTTPNAFAWTNQLQFILTRSEQVHPDHLLVYTPSTLHRTLCSANLAPIKWWSHGWTRNGRSLGQATRRTLDRIALRWNPWLAPGIIVQVRAD